MFAKNETILKVGDRVIYSKYAGTELKVDDREVLIVSEKDVLAVVGHRDVTSQDAEASPRMCRCTALHTGPCASATVERPEPVEYR